MTVFTANVWSCGRCCEHTSTPLNICKHVQTLIYMSILSNKCSRLFKDDVREQMYDRLDRPLQSFGSECKIEAHFYPLLTFGGSFTCYLTLNLSFLRPLFLWHNAPCSFVRNFKAGTISRRSGHFCRFSKSGGVLLK